MMEYEWECDGNMMGIIGNNPHVFDVEVGGFMCSYHQTYSFNGISMGNTGLFKTDQPCWLTRWDFRC